MNMSAAFYTKGKEGSGEGGVRVVFGIPEAMEVWVGSCKMLSPALKRGEVLLKSAQCWVFEALQLVLYSTIKPPR